LALVLVISVAAWLRPSIGRRTSNDYCSIRRAASAPHRHL